MKKIVLILVVLSCCLSDISSQNNIGKLIVQKSVGDIPQNICKDVKLGIIVFYSVIKGLNFEALSPSTGGNAIVNIERVKYLNADNCYVLCIHPQKEANFSVKISAEKFLPITFVVGSLGAQEMKFFMINPEDNTVEITVLGKDGKPLDNARLEITGKPVERTNSAGFRKIELSNAESATLHISHELYKDRIASSVRPGEKITVQLDQLKSDGWSDKIRKESDGWSDKIREDKDKPDESVRWKSKEPQNVIRWTGQ